MNPDDIDRAKRDAEATLKRFPKPAKRAYKTVPVSPFFPVGMMCIILAIGLSLSLFAVTFAMLWEAVFRTNQAGISENATQVLTGWGGGILGVLGAFVGYAIGTKNGKTPETPFIDSQTGMPKNPLPVPTAKEASPPMEMPMPTRPVPSKQAQPKRMPPAVPGQQGPGTSPPGQHRAPTRTTPPPMTQGQPGQAGKQ